MPTYLIRNTDTGDERLVRADNQAQALRHITRTTYSVEVATVDQGMNPFASPDTNTLRRINLHLRTALPVRVHLTADDAPPTPPVAVKRVLREGYQPKGKAAVVIDALRKHGPMTSVELSRVTGIHPRFYRHALRAPLKHKLIVELARGPIVWGAA